MLARTLSDGVTIRCFYAGETAEDTTYPKEVLASACEAYETLTQKSGFSGALSSFRDADRSYAYDPDGAIDIIIGDPEMEGSFRGYEAEDFRTSYFDPVQLESDPSACDANILVPKKIDYIRPKSRDALIFVRDSDDRTLRGTMMHEMAHVVNFYRNRNMKAVAKARNTGWFVEGMARYFETKAGSYDSYYSKGYIVRREKEYAYLEEGVNYYLEHPDRPLDKLEYDYAIFWKFLDSTYGERAIEAMTRAMRGVVSPESYEDDIIGALESSTGAAIEDILREYAYYLYRKSVSQEARDPRLEEIKHCDFYFDGRDFYAVKGETRTLIGPAHGLDEGYFLKDEGLAKGMELVGIDTTREADINPLAIDVHKIVTVLDNDKDGAHIFLENKSQARLIAQAISEDGDGRERRSFTSLAPLEKKILIELEPDARQKEKTFYVLITNADPKKGARYEFRTE
jgi:hypothetical protein